MGIHLAAILPKEATIIDDFAPGSDMPRLGLLIAENELRTCAIRVKADRHSCQWISMLRMPLVADAAHPQTETSLIRSRRLWTGPQIHQGLS